MAFNNNQSFVPQQPGAQAGPQPAAYPQPNPNTLPLGPNSPFNGPTGVPPATPAPGMSGGNGRMPGPAGSQFGGNFGAPTFGEDNYYGPQQIAGSNPDAADYGSVQQYADDAHQNAMRYLQPQQDQQNRRFNQEMINSGIDPLSPQGQERAKMLGMQQADAQNAAAFNSLGFGQGIQNQMSQQDLAKSGLAAQMQSNLWDAQLGASGQNLQKYLGDQSNSTANAQLQNQYNLGMAGIGNQRYGQDLQYQLGRAGQDLDRYGMDLSNQLGQGQLDMNRQGQDFNQMMGLESLGFRDQVYGDSRNDYQDQLMLSLLNFNKPGQAGMIDPTGFAGQTIASAGNDQGWLGALFKG